jgi:hypothetical protein
MRPPETGLRRCGGFLDLNAPPHRRQRQRDADDQGEPVTDGEAEPGHNEEQPAVGG